jgi:hypothetical protein
MNGNHIIQYNNGGTMRKTNQNDGKRTLLCFLALFVLLSTVGVVKLHPAGLETVEVDLKNRVFKNKLPFDVKFNLKVAVDPDVQRVRIEYLINKPEEKENYQYPEKVEVKKEKIPEYKKNMVTEDGKNYIYSRSLKEWVRNGDENYFLVRNVGPLHPNVEYAFKFKIYSKIKQENVAKEFHKILKLAFAKSKQDTIRDYKDAKNFIEKEINAHIDKNKIVILRGNQKDITRFKITKFKITREDDTIKEFKKLFIELFDAAEKQKRTARVIRNRCDDLKTDFKKLGYIFKLHDILYFMLRHPDDFDPSTKSKWNSPVIRKVEEGENQTVYSTTMADFAAILADGLQCRIHTVRNRLSIYDILNGTAKIQGDNVIESDSLDFDSLKLLDEFIKKINSQTFQYKKKTLCQLLEKCDRKDCIKIPKLISDLRVGLKTIFVKNELKSRLNKDFEKLAEKLSDQFARIQFIEVAEIIGTNDYKNYIALDFGIGYAFDVSMFLYSGVHVYFVPVNRKAPLKFKFKGRHWFWKRWSLLLGLTTKGIENDQYKNLFSGTSLLGGMGFRISRSFKVNGGVLLLKEIDANPLLDKDHLEIAPFASLSFDIDIQPLIGKLGTLF